MLSSPPSLPFELPSPLPEGRLPWLQSLVARLDQLAGENAELKEHVLRQAETIRDLRDEIAVLKGQNGYGTVVSGPTFAWFGSADNSRVGFLTHLHDGQPSYVLNDIALGHLQKRGLKATLVERLQTNPFVGDDRAAYLDRLGIGGERHRRMWRKVHVAVDETTKNIIDIEVTTTAWGDSEILPGINHTISKCNQLCLP